MYIGGVRLCFIADERWVGSPGKISILFYLSFFEVFKRVLAQHEPACSPAMPDVALRTPIHYIRNAVSLLYIYLPSSLDSLAYCAPIPWMVNPYLASTLCPHRSSAHVYK